MIFLKPTLPSFHDCDSVTLLELASKLHGVMLDMIEGYNKFTEDMTAEMENFKRETNNTLEASATALRQEFQDFIDCVNIKIKTLSDEVITNAREQIFMMVAETLQTEQMQEVIAGEVQTIMGSNTTREMIVAIVEELMAQYATASYTGEVEVQ